MSGSKIGYVAALVAVLAFGSNFVPVKRVQTGDGVFFQWVMCNAIFITSFPVLFAQVYWLIMCYNFGYNIYCILGIIFASTN